MQFEWRCDGCRSVIRFDPAEPMECFGQGILAGLLLANHRKGCQGNHHEDGSSVSLEVALLGATQGKSWAKIQREANRTACVAKEGGQMKPDREDVWVLVDGVGQPCLKWVRHGEPTSRERQDSIKLASPTYGPYSWHRYALVPLCGKNGECGMPSCIQAEADKETA